MANQEQKPNFDRKKHWENIYQTKKFEEVSWYQSKPETSLEFIHEFNVPKNAAIIDIGGGDSFLVDYLLGEGYEDITVLDISEHALSRAKERLGDKAQKVKWIVADAATFKPDQKYDFWHDRAAFHFLTTEDEIENYIQTINQSLNNSGVIVIGTFSEEGPTKCSGIEIKQYSENTLGKKMGKFFEKMKCKIENHLTPSQTIQNFIFCSFRKTPSLT
jgi:ubiquinone/menaquinone biosynthesis C-methylase UbiE